MTNEQKVKKYIGELQHFLEPGCGGGWPINIDKKLAKTICRDIPTFAFDNQNRLIKEPACEFDGDLMAAFWKYRYEEMEEEYYKLYDKVAAITKEF